MNSTSSPIAERDGAVLRHVVEYWQDLSRLNEGSTAAD